MCLRLETLMLVTAIAACAQNPALDHFEKKIRPVLASRCYACHGSALSAPQAGLVLETSGGIRKGGRSGPVIRVGDPEDSLMIRALRYTDKKLKMPPGGPLPPEVIADFELWIREGAALPAE